MSDQPDFVRIANASSPEALLTLADTKVNAFIDKEAAVLSSWFSEELHSTMKGVCKSVQERKQPCTTRGWFNAVVDTPFFDEKSDGK